MYPFPECTSIAVSGSTCSGKTTWVHRLLRYRDDMFINPPRDVLYCYAIWQLLFEVMEKELPFITFHGGLPNDDELNGLSSDQECNLVILDDLMDSVTSSADMENLFVKGIASSSFECVVSKSKPVLQRKIQSYDQFKRPYFSSDEKSERCVSATVFSPSSLFG